MSTMISGAIDRDGQSILASCPFFEKSPFCVNSCALFMPSIDEIDGEKIVNYQFGQCGLGEGMTQIMRAMTDKEEMAYRKKRGYE